ncbi:hypothetical protein GCM10009037_29930 [Halarchaeum grantii]|uniref:Uncharacterized protein n=1 Tax=Halarchaeum grantii TaxID=1193105 RepID=A0A830FDJ7_9EURY|nr:hypothetical protein [Halarchaeum grantii]GGL44541.1 hypothetical protein GCM10009037_29930 [Halarchaeum grantii]
MSDPTSLDIATSSLGDLIEDGRDLLNLREQLKEVAAADRRDGGDTNVEDSLALSRQNDTAYISNADREKAEWFADIYEQEGEPEIQPRGFHYRILGEGYELRDGTPYENTNKCWRASTPQGPSGTVNPANGILVDGEFVLDLTPRHSHLVQFDTL